MPPSSTDVLVPAGESETFRNTVAHAVREALDRAEERGTRTTVHFVYPIRWRPIEGAMAVPEDAQELLDRIEVWAGEDLEDVPEADRIRIVTDTVGSDRYLFSPDDYATVVRQYAESHDLERLILDPEYAPGVSAPMIEPLKNALAVEGLAVEEAPVTRPTQRSPLPRRSTMAKAGLVYGGSFVFYLLVSGNASVYNLITGAISAALVAGIFTGITVTGRQSISTLLFRFGRLLLYGMYLLWEIAKANLSVAYITLHPDLPIDPGMQRYRAAVWGDVSVTTLANSITLTPGTLTVDVSRDSLYIHSLTKSARDGLAGGGLERGVRFVYYGRKGRSLPSPAERDALEDIIPEIERLGLQEAVRRLTEQDRIAVPEASERDQR